MHRNGPTIFSQLIFFKKYLFYLINLLLLLMCMYVCHVCAGSCRGHSHEPEDALLPGTELWCFEMSCNC